MKKILITTLVCAMLTGCSSSGGKKSLTGFSSVKDDPDKPLLVRNSSDFSAVKVTSFKNIEVLKTEGESKYTTVRADFTLKNTGKRTLNFMTYFTGKLKMTDDYGENITSKYRYYFTPTQDAAALKASPVFKCYGTVNETVYISYLKPGESRNYQALLSPDGTTSRSDAAEAEADSIKKVKSITDFALIPETKLRSEVSNEDELTDAQVLKAVKNEFTAHSDVSHKISYSGSFQNGMLKGSVTNKTGRYLSYVLLLFEMKAADAYSGDIVKRIVFTDVTNLKPGATKTIKTNILRQFGGELNAPGDHGYYPSEYYESEDGTFTTDSDTFDSDTYQIRSVVPLNNAAYTVDPSKK